MVRQKTGGRQKGTPNKLNIELKERINNFLEDKWEQVIEDFDSIEPEKRIAMFEKLLQFALPKMQATKLEADINNKNNIEFVNVSKQFPKGEE